MKVGGTGKEMWGRKCKTGRRKTGVQGQVWHAGMGSKNRWNRISLGGKDGMQK